MVISDEVRHPESVFVWWTLSAGSRNVEYREVSVRIYPENLQWPVKMIILSYVLV